MQFAHKQLLLLLLLIPPAMVVFFWWAWRKRQELMTQFIRAQLLPNLTVGISTGRQKLRFILLILSAIFLILALARPQWGFDWEPTRQRGLDIVVGIDTSKSMLAEDIAPNRLTRAKLAALDLMQQAKSDRLGLVAFAGSAFLQCPLTIDDSAFRQSVDSLDVNTIPQGGTAIAEAIETAMSAFKEEDNYKVLILLTDGEDQDSGALEAAKKAGASGLRIYTIGIGTADGELLRVKDGKGRTDYIRDEQGNVVKSHLNESLLRDIAGASAAGAYLPLRGAKVIDTLYQELAKLPKSEHEEKLIRQYHERYQWPLAFAIACLLAELVIPESKRAKSKKNSRTVSQLTAAAAAFGVFCALAPNTFASSSRALREYNSGKYDEAFKDYEQLLKKNADDPRLHFNAGAAAYKNRQFEAAAKEFNDALSTPDLQLQQRAHYNRGNALFRLGESVQEPQKHKEHWENALKAYASALKLNQADEDARFNEAFVRKKLEEQKQKSDSKGDDVPPSEDAKKAKAAADEAVKRRDYPGALKIMQDQLQKDPTTRHYSDYIQKLEEVTGVQTGTNH